MGTRRRSNSLTTGRSRVVGALAGMLALLALPGCLAPTSYGWEGDERRIMASYSAWTLHSDLPSGVTVPAAIAAADRTMSDSGYTVTARDATTDKGRVVARPPDPKLFRRAVIGVRRLRVGSRVTITIEPGGDETLSREILERMLSRLGY